MQDKELNKEIGFKLRQLRLKKDITEFEVAKVINKDISTYSRVERGERTLKNSEAELLADFYEVDINDIKPQQEAIHIIDSFQDSPNSGNINSTLVPTEFLNAMHEMIKQNSLLLQRVFEKLDATDK